MREDLITDVERLSDELGLSDEACEMACGYAKRAWLEHPINRSPRVVVAASVYLASLMVNEKRTQAEVQGASGVSRVGIRDAYQEIAEHEIPTEMYEPSDQVAQTQPRSLTARIRAKCSPDGLLTTLRGGDR